MTTFNEADIARDASGRFAASSTAETKIIGLVSNRRAAKAARAAFGKHDDADVFPAERFERYLDAHRDDDAATSASRAADYIDGYLGTSDSDRSDAYRQGRRDALTDRYYSPCRVGATSWHPESIEASRRENEEQAALHFQRHDLDFDSAEFDPEVTDARTRFEAAREEYNAASAPTPHDTHSDARTRALGASVDEAFIRYESRRITKAANS